MEGSTVANATYVKPVFVTASGMTVVTNVQVGAAITGAPADNNDAGLVSFDDTMFTVDENGFVQLIGGGAGIDSINVDTSTAPGTDPVVADAGGMITVTGAQVAAGTVGTNVIRTDSLVANTYTIEIQRATTAASPTLTANGVSHFDSDLFTVDSSGFVSASSTGLGQTITGDTGGSLSPTAGNWDVLGGHDINTAGVGSTLTVHLDNAITLGDLAVLGAGVNALTATTGDINIAAGNFELPATNAALTQGVISQSGSSLRFHTFGNTNIFIGSGAGNGTLSGADNNTGIGLNSLSGLTSGDTNVGIGDNCLRNVSSGSNNCGMGVATLTTLTTSVNNTCIGHNSGNLISTGSGRNVGLGYQTINKITTGTDNTGIGYQAGFSYTGTETNNICIGAGTVGTLGESNVTRIGTTQNACYIDGIDGVNVGSTATVVTEASDRLGTAVITAGTGIDVTPGANTITIAVDGSTMLTLTPDWDFDGTAAVPVAPQSGNINVLGYNPSPTNTASNFVTASLNSTGASTGNLQFEHRAWTTQYIVDPSTTVGTRGTYSTIASAYAAAKSAGSGTIFIRAGTYTENITMDTANVNLCAFSCDGQSETARVTIVGKFTVTYDGSASISGCFLKGNTDNFISLTGGSASKLYLYNCSLNAAGATGISQNRASSYIFCEFCTFVVNSNDAPFAITSGNFYVINSTTLNWGGDATATAAAGTLRLWNSLLQFILSTSGTCTLQMICSEIRGNNTTCLTIAGNTGNDAVKNSSLISGTAAAVSVSAGATLSLQSVAITSSNLNTITGAGTVSYSDVSFTSVVAINTTTQVPLLSQPGLVKVTTPGAYPYTTIPQDGVILVDTSSARTINLNASPQTGQTYRIKDNVGSAGANNITVTPAAGNIDGAASYAINVNYGSIDVVYNGTQWNVL